MGKFSLRRYDTQARVSVIVSIASVITLIGLTLMVFRGFVAEELTIYYGPNRKLGVFPAGALTLLLSAIGFGLGLNSVGQRRNDKQQFSWLGFFIGACVLCLALVVLAIFRLRGEAIILG